MCCVQGSVAAGWLIRTGSTKAGKPGHLRIFKEEKKRNHIFIKCKDNEITDLLSKSEIAAAQMKWRTFNI